MRAAPSCCIRLRSRAGREGKKEKESKGGGGEEREGGKMCVCVCLCVIDALTHTCTHATKERVRAHTQHRTLRSQTCWGSWYPASASDTSCSYTRTHTHTHTHKYTHTPSFQKNVLCFLLYAFKQLVSPCQCAFWREAHVKERFFLFI